MPRTHAWKLITCELTEDDMFRGAMKTHTASKSQLMPCSSCASGTPHSMRYQLLSCACSQCDAVAPLATCPWRGKMVTGLASNTVSVSELGKHFSAVKPHKKPTISRIQRAYIHEMTRENITPLRILHGMTRKFGKTLNELPELRKVQNAANHYRRTKMGDRDPSKFIFHIDATYQLAQANYPVIVCGYSDGARKFYLLPLFISSQLEEKHYTEAIAGLQSTYAKVVGKPLDVRFVMGDADKAQFNGIKNTFGVVSNYTTLMCFYHVVAKVRLALKERTHRLHGDRIADVYRGVYDLHFAISEEEFLALKAKVIADWTLNPELDNFRAYMEKQWFKGNYCNWQAFMTPSGFASTNNLCETFNRSFKRDYTQKRRLKLAVLLQQMLDCCSHRSMAPIVFEERRTSDKRLLARSTALRRGGFLWEHAFNRDSISFLIDDAGDSRVRVLAVPAQRFYIPSRGRSEEALDVAAQFSVNYARMEIEGQPSTGWPVDLESKHCPCRYHAKMRDCVHLQFALQLRNYVDGDGERLMVNRSRKRRRQEGSDLMQHAIGRPRLAGHALQRD